MSGLSSTSPSLVTMGDTVVDQERVTGLRGKPAQAVAIYTIQDGKIARVTFAR